MKGYIKSIDRILRDVRKVSYTGNDARCRNGNNLCQPFGTEICCRLGHVVIIEQWFTHPGKRHMKNGRGSTRCLDNFHPLHHLGDDLLSGQIASHPLLTSCTEFTSNVASIL